MQVLIAKSLVWVEVLVSDTLSMLDPPSWIFCCCLCHGDTVDLGLHNWPLHVLQQIVNQVDVRVNQLLTQVLGLGWSSH